MKDYGEAGQNRRESRPIHIPVPSPEKEGGVCGNSSFLIQILKKVFIKGFSDL